MKAKLTLELEDPISGKNCIMSYEPSCFNISYTVDGDFPIENLLDMQKIGIDIHAHIIDVMSKKMYEILKNKTNN